MGRKSVGALVGIVYLALAFPGNAQDTAKRSKQLPEKHNNHYHYFIQQVPDLVDLAMKCSTPESVTVKTNKNFHYFTDQYIIRSKDGSVVFNFTDGSPNVKPNGHLNNGDIVGLRYNNKKFEVNCIIGSGCGNLGYSALEQKKAVEVLKKDLRDCKKGVRL